MINPKSFTSSIFQCSIFVCLVIFTLGCNTSMKEADGGKTSMPARDINVVKEAHTQELMALPGVVGVYVGELTDHTPCIGVMVVKKTPVLEQKIPRMLEGYAVRIDETGVIRPMK